MVYIHFEIETELGPFAPNDLGSRGPQVVLVILQEVNTALQENSQHLESQLVTIQPPAIKSVND